MEHSFKCQRYTVYIFILYIDKMLEYMYPRILPTCVSMLVKYFDVL